MEITLFGLIAGVWLGWMYLDRRIFLSKEKQRLQLSRVSDSKKESRSRFANVYRNLGKKREEQDKLSKSQQDLEKKLKEAGLDNEEERGKYFLIRALAFVIGPGIGLSGYFVLPTYYATVMLLFVSIISLCVPIAWLKIKKAQRLEDLQRELPLLLDLVNLGTSAGWDVSASLERVVDALYVEFPGHPLMHEFKRAVWATSTGITWNEALSRISTRLENDSVRRSTLALGQAIKQGGDRSGQLEGIAADAQRSYQSALDKRLAALPVKAILITLMLMCSYFLMLLAPAAIQIKNNLY